MSAFPVKFTVVRPADFPETLIGQGATRVAILKKLATLCASGKTKLVPNFGAVNEKWFDSVESATEYQTFLIDLFTNNNVGQEFVDSAVNAVIETV